MKKKMVALFLALLLVLPLLSGCHGKQKRNSVLIPDDFDSQTPVEITFWAKNDTNKAQTDIYNAAAENFHKLYPNVEVNIRLYTDYQRIYNDVITNISTNTTPNVCITYPDHIATYLTGQNVVVPLEELMSDPEYGLGGTAVRFDSPTAEEIVPKFLEECRINGKICALPYMRSTEALYINADFVKKLGYEVPDIPTWDFVWEVSEAAMEKGADGNFLLNGQQVLIPFIYKSTDNMMISMLKQLNAGYSDPDGTVRIFNDVTAARLNEIYLHAKSRAFSTFTISSYPANFLNAGQCIFAIDSTAGATWMGSHAPLLDIPEDQLVEFETVVRPIPQFDPENPQMISQGPSVCIFAKENPQEVLASWLFVQYLLSNDVQIPYAETEGYVPVTLKAQQSGEYLEYLKQIGNDGNTHYGIKIEASELLLNNMQNTFVTPVFNGSASLRSAAGQMIEEVTKSARRKQEVNEKYIADLYDKMVSLYRLDQITVNDGGETGENETASEPEDPEISASSRFLLIAIGAIWILIGIATLIRTKKNQRKN